MVSEIHCPVCGETANGVIEPGSVLTSPDSGQWCYKDGRFFIHEKLEWEVSELPSQPEAKGVDDG
jgi:hypothetical protein